MPLGPGKYGANAEKLLAEHGGRLCLILLLARQGPSFDVATTDPLLLFDIPTLLRDLADKIDSELRAGRV